MQMIFFKVYPASHYITNRIKPGSNSKKTDKHAANSSKSVCWGVIDCSYNNVVIGISLLDKKAIFAYTGKIDATKSF